MKILSQEQKDFILEHFFKNEDYAGWKNIANKLLDTGKCIVAGDSCIWKGGIGNFIKVDTAKDGVDCLEYKFNVSSFLTSEWFKEIKGHYMAIEGKKLHDLQNKLSEISVL
jgi:hypothetical protein